MARPKVSVLVVTYNHADLIDQALQSVYNQIADFEFEVLISEDASTDGTRAIVEAWRRRFPEKTRLLLSEQNLKSNEAVRRGFHAARGDYVALLDGDDYWTSPDKLATQAAVLDADPTLSLCFHNARVSQGATRFGDLWTDPGLKRRLALADLWEGNPFPTCGSMFRRACVPEVPTWYRDLQPMITDWPLYLLFAERGDIAFSPDVKGVYRLHDGGVYSPQSTPSKIDLMDRLYRGVNDGLERRHDGALRRGHYRYFVDMARAHLDEGEFQCARKCLRAARDYGAAAGLSDGLRTMTLTLQAHLRRSNAP
jgi:glycosyltransferase involved in cell wall biosynthesis